MPRISSAAPRMQVDFQDAPEAPPPQSVDTVVKPKPAAADDAFVAAKPAAKSAPKAASKPAAPSMQDLIDHAPEGYQLDVLKKAGLDDETLNKLSAEQRADAFAQVVKAALTPGPHSITVKWTETHVEGESSESGGYQVADAKSQTVKFSSKTAGQVNGYKLDPKTVVGTASSVDLLSDGVVSDTLKAMGASPEGGRDLLTAVLIAAKTPGAHEVSSSQTFQYATDDSGSTHTQVQTYTASFDADKKGRITVNGKPLPTQDALDMSKALEQLPVDEQRAELIGAGFPQDKVMGITPAEVHRALTEVSLQISKPSGLQEFEVALGGDDFKVKPQLDDNGKLKGLDISEKPKSRSRWKKFTDGLKKVAGPILTVLSFIPVTAVFAQIASAALSVYNGIKNHNPLGIVAGIAGGIGGVAQGFAGAVSEGVASVAQTVGNIAGTASSALQAVKSKNPGSILGFLAGAAGNLAGVVADGSQDLADTLRGVSNGARQAQQVYSLAGAIRNHDYGALVSAGAMAMGLDGPTRVTASGSRSSSSAATVDESGEDDGAVSYDDGEQRYDGAGVDDSGSAQDPDALDPDLAAARNDDGGVDPQTGDVGELAGDTLLPAPHKVTRGETLSAIAQRELGDANRWPELYMYNRDRIGDDPNLLRSGVQLEVPPPFFKVDSDTRAELYAQAHLAPPSAQDDDLPAPRSLDGTTKPVVVPTRNGPVDVADVGVELAGKLGGGVNAIMLTAMMREDGVTPDSAVYQKGMEQIRAITGRDLTPTELRDLDHFLTTYAYVQGEGGSNEGANRYLRVLGAEANAVGIGAATVAYSAIKGLSQTTGVDFMKYATFGKESAFGANTSQASVNEVWQGLRGAVYGLRDTK